MTPNQTSDWSSLDWQIWLDGLPHTMPHSDLTYLDQQLLAHVHDNIEIRFRLLVRMASSGYREGFARIETFLGEVGRLKYIKPIYQALWEQINTKHLAIRCFRNYEERYHPIARSIIASFLK